MSTLVISPSDVYERLQQHASAFASFGKRAVEALYEQGRIVESVYKDCELAHIPVKEWIPQHLNCTLRTAQNLRSVYLNYQRVQDRIHLLPVTGIYHLCAPSTPQGAVDEIFSRLEDGEIISADEIERVCRNKRTMEVALELGTYMEHKHTDPDTGKIDKRAIGSSVLSLIEVAREHAATGAISIEGESIPSGSFFDKAVGEQTHERQQQHLAEKTVLDSLFKVENGRITIPMPDYGDGQLVRVIVRSTD